MIFSRFREEIGDRQHLRDLKGTDITETDLENLKDTEIKETDLKYKNTTSQAPEISEVPHQPQTQHLGGAPHGSNGRSFHTVFLLLDFLACFVLLLVLFIVYLCIGRTPHTPDDEHIIEHRRQWYNFADTVTAFYCARGIGLLIDVLFRVWEKSFDVPAGKVDDNLRRLHRNMLVCKEWAVAFGRLASMGLFIGLLWGKVGWWSRSVVKDWNDHHLKDDWVNIWN